MAREMLLEGSMPVRQVLASGAHTHGGPNGLTQLFDAGTPAIHIRAMLLLHASLGNDIGQLIGELGNRRRVLLDVLERLIAERLWHWCSLLSPPAPCGAEGGPTCSWAYIRA
jgi:hypothetical protein